MHPPCSNIDTHGDLVKHNLQIISENVVGSTCKKKGKKVAEKKMNQNMKVLNYRVRGEKND